MSLPISTPIREEIPTYQLLMLNIRFRSRIFSNDPCQEARMEEVILTQAQQSHRKNLLHLTQVQVEQEK